MPQTSNKGLEVILQTEPLHLFPEGVAIKTRIKTESQVPLTWDGDSTYHYRKSSQDRFSKKKIGHLKSLDNKIKEIFPTSLILDKTKKKRNKCSVKINFQGKITNCEDHINIYTDGSKMNTGTGSGIAFTSGDYIIDEEKYKLSDSAIVYQAELFAIFHACKWIKKHNEKDHK